MYVATKEVIIHAAHRLSKMPDGHQCRRLHGHTYKVIVQIGAMTLDAAAMLVDLGLIGDAIKRYDHTYLGDGPLVDQITGEVISPMLPDDMPSTAELFATVIAHDISALLTKVNDGDTDPMKTVHLGYVDIWETPTSNFRFTVTDLQ